MSGFDELGLAPAWLRAAQALGYRQATAVQQATVPAVQAGRDVLATARTGTGKTAAYAFGLLPGLVDRLQQARQQPSGSQPQATSALTRPPARSSRRRPAALVLVPTRELAAQVAETFGQILRLQPEPVKLATLYGGVSINPQLMALRGGADLVVATPGRLLDVVDHNGLDLSGLQVLVLDEADRLLDPGFADELHQVLQQLPPGRQNLLFSATMAPAVERLAQTLLQEPLRIAIADDEAALPAEERRLQERVIAVDAAQRAPLLRQLIRSEGWRQVLVFVATRYACDHLADKLRRSGIPAAAFHGDASQGTRAHTLWAFRSGELQVLVATDLGARGIDLPQLPVVVNHDLPRATVDYVHRIGRTARAGASGLAISFVPAAAEAHFRLIEKRIGRRLEREQVPGFEPREAAPAPGTPGAHDGTGGIKGRRPSKKDKLRAAAAAQTNPQPPRR